MCAIRRTLSGPSDFLVSLSEDGRCAPGRPVCPQEANVMQGRKHESWRQYRPACIQRYYTCLKRATREPLRCPLLDSPGGSSSQILIEFVYVGCLWACRHAAVVGHFLPAPNLVVEDALYTVSVRRVSLTDLRVVPTATHLLSPKSPRPGMIYAFSFSPWSIHPVICATTRRSVRAHHLHSPLHNLQHGSADTFRRSS